MKLNIDIDNTTLDILTTKLKKIVSPLDILKWLSNFKESEIQIAIEILSQLTVYTTNEIEEILNNEFKSLFEYFAENDLIVVNPIGKFGKSGSMITYFLQKTQLYKSNKKKIILSPSLIDLEFKKDLSYFLVLVDDFVGTGESVETHFQEVVKPYKNSFKNIYFIGISGMLFGIERIKHLFKEIKIPESNKFKKAFSSEASYFGYRHYSMYRELAYEYGYNLVNPKESKTGKKNALGYENSQALVSFAYGSPNNTLPIIWANTDGWFPLIPRFSVDKVSSARILRKIILHELSILREFGSDNLKDNFFSFKIKKGKWKFSTVDKIDFSIYSIIKLSRKGYTNISICQILGILLSDFEEIIKKGIDKQIFNPDNSLSLYGLNLYKDAKKCIEERKLVIENETEYFYRIRNVKYLPKTFNGKS